jgi:hypothetical protein
VTAAAVAAAVENKTRLRAQKLSVAPAKILFGATFYLVARLRPRPYNRRNTLHGMRYIYGWPFSIFSLKVEKSENRRFFVLFLVKKPLNKYPIDNEIGLCVNTL